MGLGPSRASTRREVSRCTTSRETLSWPTRTTTPIRKINATRFVFTIAGQIVRKNVEEGCPPPCVHGVPGYRDGNSSIARFEYPKSVPLLMNPHQDMLRRPTMSHLVKRK